MALFESYERRIDKIYRGFKELRYQLPSRRQRRLQKTQVLTYMIRLRRSSQSVLRMLAGLTVGAAIAIKKGCRKAADAAAAIGEGLQAFCIPGSVADNRKVGLGHGNLGKMLLEEETDCFCF